MTATPSPVLIDQTSTALPSLFTGVFCLVMLSIVCYRIVVIRDRRPTSTAANWYGFWIICYAATRIPEVQSVLMSIPGVTLVDVRTTGSAADIAAAIALLLLAIRWRSVTGMASRRSVAVAGAVWMILTALLFILAVPAREGQVAIEEIAGWRGAVYATAYSGGFLIAESLIVVTLVQMSFDSQASTSRRLLAGTLMAAIAVSAVSLSTRIAGAWLASFGVDSGLSAFRSAGQNDVAFYMSVLWLIPAAAPLVVVDLRSRLGLDRGVSEEIALLRPMWKDLTAVCPEHRLTVGSALPSEVEILHRMRIEIEDSLLALSRRLPRAVTWPADAAGRCAMIRSACEVRPTDRDPAAVAPEWISDDVAVDAVAYEWVKSGRLLQRSDVAAHPLDDCGFVARTTSSDVLDAELAGLDEHR